MILLLLALAVSRLPSANAVYPAETDRLIEALYSGSAHRIDLFDGPNANDLLQRTVSFLMKYAPPS